MKHENLVLSNELIKVELPLRKIWKTDFSSISPQSDLINVSEKIVSFPLVKGLCLKRRLFIIFHGGNLNLSTPWTKPNPYIQMYNDISV